MEKERIIKVRKDNHDRAVEFMTDKGNVYNYEVAKELVEARQIDNGELYKGSDGLMHVRTKENNTTNYFTNLEEF